MSEFDIPAILAYIQEKTVTDKVSYIGYSQSTTIMYHALAKAAAGDSALKESYSAVDKFISIAPCLYTGPENDDEKE